MNREQKLAWWIVICAAFAFVASLVTVYLLYPKYGMPKALSGFMMMSLVGVSGLGWIFTKKDKGRVKIDERDQEIKKNAAHMGFLAAFLFAGAACMIPFFVLGPDASITVKFLPQIWILTFITQAIVDSISILVQYGRGGKENE